MGGRATLFGRRPGRAGASLPALCAIAVVALLPAVPATAAANAAVVFDGGSTSVTAPDSPSLRLPATFTAEAWAKPTTVLSHRHVMGKHLAWELSVDPSGPGFQVDFEINTTVRW